MNKKDIQLYRPTSDLLASTSQQEIVEIANRIQKYAPGGDNLSLQQAAQLAVYSFMVDANPYNGEAYMTKTGPMLGVTLYRRKAKEYNRVMAPSGEEWDYKVNYRIASTNEASYDPEKGDVAWMCELTDTKAEKEWQNAYSKFFAMLIEAKADYKFADERALMMAGPRPVWSAVGVVAAAEKFSAVEAAEWKTASSGKKYAEPKVDENGAPIYKPEMWDRNERAKKRAEKGALKKRYPDLVIPEFGEVFDGNVEVSIRNAIGEMEKAEKIQADIDKNLDPNQVIAELYGGTATSTTPIVDVIIPETAEIYKAVVEAGYAENEHAAENALKKCETGYSTKEMAIAWMRKYRAWRDVGVKSDPAATKANAGEEPSS